MRALVIGGGIGGLTAALALQQRGVAVEVYERAARLEEVGAGISLWPNALKALYRLGLEERLRAISFVAATGAVRRQDGAILSATSAKTFVDRFGLPTTVFHRAELLRVLLDAVAGTPIHLGRACETVEQDAHGATAVFADGGPAHGDVLIGADGVRSRIRDHLGVSGPLRYAGYTAWRGIAPFETSRLVGGETLGCGQRFGLVPIARERVYWYATTNTEEGQTEDAASTHTTLRRLFARWHGPIPALLDATDPAAIIRSDIYDRDPVDRWGSGRVTLLGDAAHPMTPNLGQGACQAIEDALFLAGCLAAGGPIEAALRRYEAVRRPRTAAVVRASRNVGRIGQIQSPVLCRVRDLLLRVTPVAMTLRQLAPIVEYEGHLHAGPPS